MGKFEHFDNATIYLGNYRDIMPVVGVDALVCDPPYGIGDRMEGGTWGRAKKYEEFRQWDVPPAWPDLAALIAVAPNAIIWGGNYFGLPPSRCWLVWNKLDSPTTMANVELAWTNFDRPSKRYESAKTRPTCEHPTEKPVDLILWCLGQIPGEPRSIFDPYMGSGTTGVAALRLGMTFIGAEAIEKYFDIACRRIERAAAQTDMFAPSRTRETITQGTLL